MRNPLAVIACIAAVACQTAPQNDASPGSTTYSRGASTVTRSETTRVGGEAPGAGATLTLDRSSYAPGASATMRITNETRDTLGYNPCSSRTVERRDGERWVAHPEPGRMCTMELRLVHPNETQTASTDIPGDLRRGTYRMVLTLTRQSTQRGGDAGVVRAVSPTFTVN